MTFVLSDYVVLVLCLVGIIITVLIMHFAAKAEPKTMVVTVAILLVITALIFCGGGWYNANTASGQRAVKDFESEMNNGIEREITITAEDGREIFHYEGKIDIESNHTDNYIKFESEEGKRYIIYYGIQDTILIIEK